MSKSIVSLVILWLVSFHVKAEQPIFTISSLDATPGEIIDINIHVDNFSDIVSTQFSINWDPTVLTFRAGKNFNASIPGFSTNSLGTVEIAEGKLRIQWLEASVTPITIADGSLYFTLEFEVVGDPCESSNIAITDDPLEIEVGEGVQGVDVGLVSNVGNVSIPGSGCSADIHITGASLVGACGSNVCVPFTVQDFNNVVAMDYSMVFDPTVLEFTGIQNFAPLLGFNAGSSTFLVTPDSLRVVWTNSNVENQSLPDGTVLYEMCFDVIGAGGSSSTITFGTNQVLFSDVDNNEHNVTITPGMVTAQCAIEGFALIAEEFCTEPGIEYCMPVRVNDFDDIVAMQFSMNWDSTRFRFDRVQNFMLDGLDENAFGFPYASQDVKQGQLIVSWIDLSLQGQTLPDNKVIFELCLDPVGPVGSSSPVTFSGNPREIEFLNAQDSVLEFSLVQGLGNIRANCDDPDPCQISYILNVVQPSCPGVCDGVMNLNVTVTNCPFTPTYAWSTGATSEDLTGLCNGIYCVTITAGSNIVIACDTIIEPAPFGVSSNITNPNPIGGSNGSIDITVTGGTPPYSYVWSNPPGGTTQDLIGILPVGTYCVTITDNNDCEFVPDCFEVGSEVSSNITNVSCHGGSNGAIDFSASFGVAPYTYLWNTVPPQTTQDIANLSAGIYCVTATDNTGATRDTCFTVTQPNPLVVTATLTHDEEGGGCTGAIDLNVTGGIQPYSYNWSTGSPNQDILGLCAGQYCVTVTYGQGCTVDTCFTIGSGDFFVTLSPTQFGNFEISCAGNCDGAITSTVVGGTAPYTYTWSTTQTNPDLANLCAGTYSLTVADATGQSASSSVVLAAPPAINIDTMYTLPSDFGSFDGSVSVVVTGGNPGYTYQWSGPVTGTTASLNNIPGGSYLLVVTDESGCQETVAISLIPIDLECYKGLSVITPNEDGRNDFFLIPCVLDAPNHLYIFNRYGGLVWETNNYFNNWDGVDQDDEEVPDGGYLWVLEVTQPGNVKQLYKGTVNVLRTAD
jgi:gliding motility-associated-like protein